MPMNSNPFKNFVIMLFLSGCFIFYSAPASSQSNFDFRSETIFGIFERDTEEQKDSLVIPIYEYLQFNFGNLEGDGLSLHVNGWGRVDSGDSGFYEDDPDGVLLYAFLEYINSSLNLQARLGRQKIINGVTTDSVEGIWISSTPIPWLGFSAYGGLPVALKSAEDRDEDITWGARMFHRLAAYYEVGLSYKIITGDLGEDDERLGVDLFISLPGRVSLSGFSSQNLVTGGWGEHSYEIAFYLNDLYVKPFYQRVSYEDFFNSGSISARPFRFLSDTGEILNLYGGEVAWQFSGGLDISAKYNYYDYQIREETASYFGGLLNGSVGKALLGAEIGLMDGKTAENRYMMTRTFFNWNRPLKLFNKGMFTGDVLYVLYDEKIFNKKSSLFASLGAGRRFLQDKLELRFSGQYSSGPFYDSDLRAVVKAILNL
jgi:hypothetical protein